MVLQVVKYYMFVADPFVLNIVLQMWHLLDIGI